MSEFSKKYNAAAIENDIRKLWEQDTPSSKVDGVFCSLPLPSSTALHLGHAENALVQDVFARYNHLIGKSMDFTPSWYYGSFLANELIQKHLNKLGTRKGKISRAQFWDLIQKHINKQKRGNQLQLHKLGIDIDLSRQQLAFGVTFPRFLRGLFYKLVQDDVIYEAEDIVYRNTKYQTSLGKDEVKFKKHKGKTYTIKYFISTKNNSVNIITNTPETLFADVALAVNPQNKRYNGLVGQEAIIPIINKTIPIIADERVDMFANNGIMRITPAHDLLSLQIAKEHNLPIDRFAIDQDGCFTKHAGDFAGKNVDEFMDNILQNLDDIDNMVEIKNTEFEIPICKKTGEKLQTMCLVQRFLDVERGKEQLHSAIQDEKIHTYPSTFLTELGDQVDTISRRCISKNYLFGQQLPIWISEKKGMIYVLDEEDVIDSYKKDKNKSKLKVFLTMIIFNLVAHGHLDTTFQVDDLINVLLSSSAESDKTILQTYIDIFTKEWTVYKPQLKELQEIMKYAGDNKPDNLEKFATLLIKILDNSFAIKQVTPQKYSFLSDKFIQRDSGLKQEQSKFDIAFVNAALLLYNLGINEKSSKQKKLLPTLMTAGPKSILEVAKVLLLSLQLYDTIPFENIFFNKLCCDHKEKKMGTLCQNNIQVHSLITKYGTDVTRLYLLSHDTETFCFDKSQPPTFTTLLDSFWNACRYVSMKAKDNYSTKGINLASLEKELGKHTTSFEDFDLWILTRVKQLYQELDAAMTTNTIPEFGKRLVDIISYDFCRKYIEISKYSNSALTGKVMIFTVGKILQLLSLYAPFVSEKLWILMGFQGSLREEKLSENFLGDINKNYKIQLFMDIIDTLLQMKQQLGCKKHDTMDAFLKANPDFLRFTKANEEVIKKIVNMNKISYMDTHEDTPGGYTTEDIIDMTIGVKASSTRNIVEEKPKSLKELKKEFDQMTEYLQYLKSTVSSMQTNNGDESEIAKKKREINTLKKNMLELEYEINKMRTK